MDALVYQRARSGGTPLWFGGIHLKTPRIILSLERSLIARVIYNNRCIGYPSGSSSGVQDRTAERDFGVPLGHHSSRARDELQPFGAKGAAHHLVPTAP